MSNPKIEVLNDDLIAYRGVLWFRAKSRKSAKCKECGVAIKPGDYAWRQMGNKSDRYVRISDLHMKRILKIERDKAAGGIGRADA